MAWKFLLIFFLVSVVGCSIGFKKTVYFLSVGYGFSIALLGIAFLVVILAGGYPAGAVMVLQCVLFVIYGARLSGFLIYREQKSAAYRKVLKNAKGGTSEGSIGGKIGIWLGVSALYVLQTCPVFYRACNGAGARTGAGIVLPLVGALITALGITLEALADVEKDKSKKVRPDAPAMQGLFRMVRCPNFFGELLVWTGVFVGSLDALSGAGQWIAAILGYAMIFMIMITSAQRLERGQEQRYGKNPEYRQYADHTPILFPLIPLYHMGNYGAKDGR